jgi:hypothetical protein
MQPRHAFIVIDRPVPQPGRLKTPHVKRYTKLGTRRNTKVDSLMRFGRFANDDVLSASVLGAVALTKRRHRSGSAGF